MKPSEKAIDPLVAIAARVRPGIVAAFAQAFDFAGFLRPMPQAKGRQACGKSARAASCRHRLRLLPRAVARAR